jgi:hypothetical protein
VLPQVMRPRRAVPKIPPGCPVPLRLPLYKNHLLLTHSESTLPQMLIPLHFNSRRIRVYKKTGEGISSVWRRGLQLVTTPASSIRARTNSRKPNHLYALLTILWIPRGEGGEAHFRPIFIFSYFEFRVSIFVFRISYFECAFCRGSLRLWAVSCRLAAAYLPRNFSMVESSASAISKYFLAPLVSCFCMAAWALARSVFMCCWAATMSPRSP